jgi:predicted methyltransferase
MFKNIVITLNLRESAFFTLIKYGYYKHQVTENFVIKCIVCSNETVIDVGVNIGWISLVFAESVGTNGSIYSLEPSNKIFFYLDQVVKLKNQIKAFQLAFSDCKGKAIFTNETCSDLSHIKDEPTFNSEIVQ